MEDKYYTIKVIIITMGILLVLFGQYCIPLILSNNSHSDLMSNILFWMGIVICVFGLIINRLTNKQEKM